MTKNEFDKAVSKLFYISGYGLPDKRIFDYVTDFVYTSICDKYSDQEIEHVFESGLKKKYGEYVGISATLIYGWFEKFKQSGEREILFPKKMIAETSCMTDDEKEIKSREYCLRCYDEFKQEGEFNDMGNIIYNYLEKKEVLNLTPEQKWKFYGQAKEKEISKLQSKKLKQTSLRSAIEREISAIENKTNDAPVIIAAKKLALTDYFETCVKMDIDLSELI